MEFLQIYYTIKNKQQMRKIASVAANITLRYRGTNTFESNNISLQKKKDNKVNENRKNKQNGEEKTFISLT